jgi:hypothetical protein
MPSDYATGFGHVTILAREDEPSMRAAVNPCRAPRRAVLMRVRHGRSIAA